MKNIIQTIALIFFAAITATVAGAQVAKMTSVYTNLKTDCQPETKVTDEEVPFICKAVGGYRIRIVPAGAWAEMIEIIDAKNEQVASLGTHGYGYSVSGRRMVEWRMANGKPFAVIFRVNKYIPDEMPENGDSPYLDKYKTGEALLIRGLKGYSQIDFEIDAKSTLR